MVMTFKSLPDRMLRCRPLSLRNHDHCILQVMEVVVLLIAMILAGGVVHCGFHLTYIRQWSNYETHEMRETPIETVQLSINIRCWCFTHWVMTLQGAENPEDTDSIGFFRVFRS